MPITKLAYEVMHEAWYWPIPGAPMDLAHEIVVGRYEIVNGITGAFSWRFLVKWHWPSECVDKPVLHLDIWQEGLPAFREIPTFFTDLFSGIQPSSVIETLNALGFEDATPRVMSRQ